jgi:hypothetical protein
LIGIETSHFTDKIYEITQVKIWFHIILIVVWGTPWRSWLKHCATSRKVAVLVPDGVIEKFHWHNPSGRTVALGFT